MKKLLLTATGLVILTSFTTGLWSGESTAHSEADNNQPISNQPISKAPNAVAAYEKHSIEDILSNSTDQELVKISGEIIRKIKCSTYLFRGETGDIQIRIGMDAVPDRGIPFKEAMVIKGTVSNSEEDKPTVKADHIRFAF